MHLLYSKNIATSINLHKLIEKRQSKGIIEEINNYGIDTIDANRDMQCD